MIQQVNLLKALPRKSNILPATHIALANLALLVLCMIISIYLGINQILAKVAYGRAQETMAQASAEYAELVKKYPLLATDKPLLTMVTEFEKSLRERQASFAKLSHATSRRPFSKFMQTLAQTAPEGLWITQFDIDQDTEDMSFKGYSLRPIFVSVFLDNLQKSAAFSGVVFDLFYVKKVKDKDYIQFEIANDNLSSDKEGEKETEANSEETTDSTVKQESSSERKSN